RGPEEGARPLAVPSRGAPPHPPPSSGARTRHPSRTGSPVSAKPQVPRNKPFDRRIVEGPVTPAVWRLAWPSVLQNVIGGLQGMIDHAMVGHYVGYVGNAAIGVAWQIFLVVIVFIASVFSGM